MPRNAHPDPLTLPAVRALFASVMDAVRDDLPQVLALRQSVTLKADGSPVTDADLRMERRIADHLRGHLPDLHFISEESPDSHAATASGAIIAMLDPIDGTENFCSGLPEWGVSLTLWQGGTHLGSLLFLPEMNLHLMTGDTIPRARSRIAGFSSSINPALLAAMGDAGEARMMGCAVYNLFNVVRGAFASFSNPKGAQAWDLLAGLMLAQEHGCDVSVDGVAFDGRFLQPDRKYRVHIQHRYDFCAGQGTVG